MIKAKWVREAVTGPVAAVDEAVANFAAVGLATISRT